MWVRTLGTQFLSPQWCNGCTGEVQMWAALFPVAFVAAETVGPSWPSLLPYISYCCRGCTCAPLFLGSPGVPESPKKNSQNILDIPDMSQNNIETLFSFNS